MTLYKNTKQGGEASADNSDTELKSYIKWAKNDVTMTWLAVVIVW